MESIGLGLDSLSNGRPPVSTPSSQPNSAARKPPLPPMCARNTSGGSSNTASSSFISSSGSSGPNNTTSRRRAATELVNGAALDMAKARLAAAGGMRPAGLLETDLDAPLEPSCVGRPGSRSLLNLNGGPQHHGLHQPPSLSLSIAGNGCCVDDDLDEADAAAIRSNRHHRHHHQQLRQPGDVDTGAGGGPHRPHKSMEFLLDKENLHFVKVSLQNGFFCSLRRELETIFIVQKGE
ncbi:hypothetical protein QAD02_015687 [Eretmocerus hayati]|uniref:Uncharacterized protein n=1 Tax=Eretmocerus hayati TaxID=131215 RepID=A0ACC2P8H9_9HYME|nr:hypothetical protein QAD02_015687 [Eretmocerus hayati]